MAAKEEARVLATEVAMAVVTAAVREVVMGEGMVAERAAGTGAVMAEERAAVAKAEATVEAAMGVEKAAMAVGSAAAAKERRALPLTMRAQQRM